MGQGRWSEGRDWAGERSRSQKWSCWWSISSQEEQGPEGRKAKTPTRCHSLARGPEGRRHQAGAAKGRRASRGGGWVGATARREPPRAPGGPQGWAPESPRDLPFHSDRPQLGHLVAVTCSISRIFTRGCRRNFPSTPESFAKPGTSMRGRQERPFMPLWCRSPILKLLGAPVGLVLACGS